MKKAIFKRNVYFHLYGILKETNYREGKGGRFVGKELTAEAESPG